MKWWTDLWLKRGLRHWGCATWESTTCTPSGTPGLRYTHHPPAAGKLPQYSSEQSAHWHSTVEHSLLFVLHSEAVLCSVLYCTLCVRSSL